MVITYEAVTLYERAHQHSGWHRVAARLLGRSARLLDLNQIVAGARSALVVILEHKRC